MSGEGSISRSWTVGRYRCTLSVPPPKSGGLSCCSIEWSPSLPTKLNAAELATYTVCRDAAIGEVASELGIKALVVEL
jgi:hypothetical protein